MSTQAVPGLDFEAEFQQYVETALWASIDEQPDGNGGPPMDDTYGPTDLTADALASMRADLQDFIDGADADALAFWVDQLGTGQIGHDFWLTRNGHGAGFWDRFMDEPGERYGRILTEQAKPYGESHLWADGERVHVS